MNLPESTKVVYNRVQKLEPKNVSNILGYFLIQENADPKILGYFLIQENANLDMIRLAFNPAICFFFA